MKISKITKWVCIQNVILSPNLFILGTIIDGGLNKRKEFYYLKSDNGVHYHIPNHDRYFMPLSEWREQQIDSIFEDE